MARLEYRLFDEANGYPVLYSYPDIDPGEVAARFACDKFIKDGAVHEKTSCAIEPLTYIIYIRQAGSAGAAAVGEANPAGGKVRIEFRQDGESLSPGLIIQTLDFFDGMDVVLHLTADYFYWMGEEWLKTMTVLDEDRKVYVCYAKTSA